MNYKLLIVTAVTTLTLQAQTLIVHGTNKMAQTMKLQETSSVYLGSYLAQGHLSPKNIYRIDAPVEGVIKHLNVNIYDKVNKGDQLLIIKSPKLLELESDYIDILIEKEFYTNEVKRLEPLYKNAVVAKKVFFKATNTLAKYETQSEFYYNLLIEWGLSKKQVDAITLTKKPIPEIVIEAPISGKIADLNVYPKMYTQRGEHLMTVLNPKGVHLAVSLPLDIAKRLHVNEKLYIDETAVRVESIAATINPRTQTVFVHLLPQKKLNIMPDEKRNIKLYMPKKAFKLPASAVIDYDDKPAVFVKVQDGYQLHFIHVLGRSSEDVFFVASDLDKESDVVIKGVISLKGALEAQGDD